MPAHHFWRSVLQAHYRWNILRYVTQSWLAHTHIATQTFQLRKGWMMMWLSWDRIGGESELVCGWCGEPGYRKETLCQLFALVAFLSLAQSGVKWKISKGLKTECVIFFAFPAHFHKWSSDTCVQKTYMHTCMHMFAHSVYSMRTNLHLSLFFPGVCMCHVWLKLAPVKQLVHPLMNPPVPPLSTPPPFYHSIPVLLPPGTLTAQENMFPQGPTLPFWLPRVAFPWKQCQSWLGGCR